MGFLDLDDGEYSHLLSFLLAECLPRHIACRTNAIIVYCCIADGDELSSLEKHLPSKASEQNTGKATTQEPAKAPRWCMQALQLKITFLDNVFVDDLVAIVVMCCPCCCCLPEFSKLLLLLAV